MSGTSTHAARLESIRKADQERADFLEELIKSYDELKLRYDERTDDYKNEVESRRMWQSKATQSEQALAQHKQASSSKNFVVALIDGDGAIFQDKLLSMARGEGGAEAAHQLHTELQNHLKDTYPDQNVADWAIVAQVVLNLSGLAQKLYSSNIISSLNDLNAFGRTFGLAQPLFSFVDVGNGKERADHKIRETLRLYLPIAQCRHVFFGPCSDNGYLPVLESYRRDPALASRITLLETRPAEPGFLALGLKRLKMPQVFRSDNIPSKTGAIFSPTQMPTPIRTPSTSETGGGLTSQFPNPESPSQCSDSNGSGAPPGFWATVGKSGTAGKTISIVSNKKPARRYILLNAYDERIDEPLPRPEPGLESRFNDRVRTQGKFCNNYHLGGKCGAGEYCEYAHGPKLSPGEFLVLKHKARGICCPQKSYCRNVDCYLGHHCKFGSNCAMMDNCQFRNNHQMDKTVAKRMSEDGSEEWLPQPQKGVAWRE